MIKCQHLTHFYASTRFLNEGEHPTGPKPRLKALDDLSFTISPGEIFAFIGPNGAGKTTTIKILATLLNPTQGEAFVGGYSTVRQAEDVHALLGYMPDAFGVYEGMKVWEYLDFFAAAYKIVHHQRAAIIDKVLELTDLGSLRDSDTETLSKGMQQRLCLAKTLIHDPQVLVLDEPNAGLDPRARLETKNLLKELRRLGKTILISSHILPELSDFCTSAGVIESGRLLACGRMSELLNIFQKGRQLRLKVLRETEKAATLLERQAGVSSVKVERESIELNFSGSLEEMSKLPEIIISEGWGLLEFSELNSDLEDVFMGITQGGQEP